MSAGTIPVLLRFIEVLDHLRLDYAIGGSIASTFHGEPRATHDVDVLVALTRNSVSPFVAALQSEFYVDEISVREAVAAADSFNVIHLKEIEKIDVFVAGNRPLDRTQLERRVLRALSPETAPLFITSAEDIVLRKLVWFRTGGGVSERQWRDVQGVLKARGRTLDSRHLSAMAKELDLEDLLRRALEQAGTPPAQ